MQLMAKEIRRRRQNNPSHLHSLFTEVRQVRPQNLVMIHLVYLTYCISHRAHSVSFETLYFKQAILIEFRNFILQELKRITQKHNTMRLNVKN
jgi:hypothetical protein